MNRTIRVDLQNGDSLENHYDAEGLRNEILENGELVQFLFDGREICVETESDGNHVRYIRGLELVASDSESAVQVQICSKFELSAVALSERNKENFCEQAP